jgi:subtilisin family serine protease
MKLRRKALWGGRLALAVAVLLFASAPLRAQPRARLSDSLRKHVAAKSAAPVDVIVHGTPEEVTFLAERHGARIKKLMTGGAVLEAGAGQIESLSTEVDHLSRDVEVKTFMSVTNEATGADQVHAGLDGLRGFTGAGVGIALIDSGVWTGHRSLAGRVVYAKDFVGDGSRRDKARDNANHNALSKEDAYGHGTHVGAIIAGRSPYPADATSAAPFRGMAPGANLISLRVIGPDGIAQS